MPPTSPLSPTSCLQFNHLGLQKGGSCQQGSRQMVESEVSPFHGLSLTASSLPLPLSPSSLHPSQGGLGCRVLADPGEHPSVPVIQKHSEQECSAPSVRPLLLLLTHQDSGQGDAPSKRSLLFRPWPSGPCLQPTGQTPAPCLC